MGCNIVDGRILYSFEYNKSKVARCKYIGMRWEKKSYQWWVRANYANRIALFNMFGIRGIKQARKHKLLVSVPGYLMDHQKQAVVAADSRARYAIFFDTGVGKTLTALNIVDFMSNKALVVCPISVIDDAWIGGIEKFKLNIPYCNLRNEVKKKRFKVSMLKDYKLFIINYESFNKNIDTIKALNIDTLIIDESSRLKNSKANITKVMTSYCDDIHNIYLLSGNPAPNNWLEYYSQMRILDISLFGNSFYKFREKFFNSDYSGFHWYIKQEMKDNFLACIASKSIFVKKEDVLDLPERSDININFELSKDEYKAYKSMLSELFVEYEDENVSVTQAIAKTMKLRQIISGFFFDAEKKIVSIGTSKMLAFKQLIEDIGNHQVLIWTQFKWEAKMLKKLLEADALVCDSTVTYEQKQINMKEFQSGRVKYLIAHPRSIGMGTTFVNCSYSIYYSLSYSYEEYSQSKDRIYRKGQKNACTYYHLLCNNTLIDSIIFRALKSKKSVADGVIEYIKNMLGG